MPRYFFRLTDGEQVLSTPHPEGTELPGDAAARDEAVIIARDLKHGTDQPSEGWTGWFVSLTDQQGRELDRVSIADLPEIF